METKTFLEIIKSELALIEETLKLYLDSQHPFINQVSEYIVFSGGKRIRPLLTVLSAKLFLDGKTDNEALKVLYRTSILFEYLHAATLLHDDVVDSAEFRSVLEDTIANRISINESQKLFTKWLDRMEDNGIKFAPIVSSASAFVKNAMISLVLVVILLVVLFLNRVGNKIIYNLETFQVGLNSFFDYVNKEIDYPTKIIVDGKDEIQEMAQTINENIEKTQLLLEKDNAFINEVKLFTQNMSRGIFAQRLTVLPSSSSLIELRTILNNFAIQIKDSFDYINEVLTALSQGDFHKKYKNKDALRISMSDYREEEWLTNIPLYAIGDL